MFILNLGTYPPKQCGIASFSKDLRDNLVLYGHRVAIAALSDDNCSYIYPPEVAIVIRQRKAADYQRAAQQINITPQIDLVIIQHEYGIFGGPDGEMVLEFTRQLKKPFIMVTHTVLPQPSANQRRVLSLLTRQAAAVVCMNRGVSGLLIKIYGTAPTKITMIHHGVPVFPVHRRDQLKAHYDCLDRRVVNTFGLIGPGKGLDIGIKAVGILTKKYPDLFYMITGCTHPVLFQREGEVYREMLQVLVTKLGLDENVRFVNHFLELEEMGDYLHLADIYLSPYTNLDQAVSGTLAYAIGCGQAIVATPYQYALGMLQENHCGLVAKEASPEAIAVQMDRILADPQLQSELKMKTAALGKTLSWPFVAAEYLKLAIQVLETTKAQDAGSLAPTR